MPPGVAKPPPGDAQTSPRDAQTPLEDAQTPLGVSQLLPGVAQTQSFKFVSPWDVQKCLWLILMGPELGSVDVILVEENEIFQFCDLKANLHIRVNAFPWSKGSNLFLPIFIEILSMLYFVVG
jgi:hypothetical protein